jgi:Ca2+-binding EF-hand superfamily protein
LVKLARASDDVSRTQLMVGLQHSSIVLDSEEIDGLLHEFPGSVAETVSLSALCDAVDPQLPDSTPPTSAPSSAPPSPRSLPKPPAAILEFVARVARSAKNLGIDLENEFRGLDRLRHSRVNQTQFRSVISLLNGRWSENELRKLYAQYQFADGFDYVSFCRDASLRPNDTRPSDSEELLAILRKCKAITESKMMSIEVVFRRYDVLKTGFVPVGSICKAFADYGLLLTGAEVSQIVSAFRDSRNGDRINYRDLQAKLRSISLPREEREETLFTTWSQEEHDRVLSCAKLELREKLHVRPRAFRRLLSAGKQGRVSETDFLRVIDESGVVLKKEQIDALVHCYLNPATGDVDFLRFSQDLEEETDLFGIRSSSP